MKSPSLPLATILTILTLLITTACQSPPSPPPPPTPFLPNSGQSDATNTIRIASRDSSISRGLELAAEQWTELTGTEVIIESLSYSYLQEQIFLDVQSDDGRYDVILIDDPWFPSLAGNGLLVPLSAFDYQPDSDFVERSLEVAMWPPPTGPRHPFLADQSISQLYALPLVGNVQLFWYDNQTTAGFTSMTDMITQLEQTAANTTTYSYAYAGQAGNPIVTEFNTWNWSYGGDIFDDEWNVIIDQEASVQALTGFIQLSQSAYPDSKNLSGSTAASRSVYEGQTVASLLWPNHILDITNRQVPPNLTITTFPGEVTQLGHWLLAIPTTAPNKQEAYNFILWATSADIMTQSVESGIPPTRKSVFRDPTLVAQYPWLPDIEGAIEQSNWRPRTPEWPNIEHILGTYLSSAIQGNMPPQEALTQARNEIHALMVNAGYYE